MHRIISLLLIAILFTVTAYAELTPYRVADSYISSSAMPTAFVDSDQLDWAAEAVSFLSATGILCGDSEGRFNPTATIKRAEFTKILICALGLNNADAQITLADTAPGDWRNPYIASAISLNIASYGPDKLFRIDDPIKRQDMFFMTYKALKAMGHDLDYSTLSVFLDQNDITRGYENAIQFFSYREIISGSPEGEIFPLRDANRAEAALFIYNTLKILTGDAL